MNLDNGEFRTNADSGLYIIIIEKESDLSVDGGHSFEMVSNEYELTKAEAKRMIVELQSFVDNKEW